MNIAVIESGMIFGFYPEDNFFWIEKSEVIKKINEKAKKGEGVKISEFLLLENTAKKISLVEAKTNPPPLDDENPGLENFIEDVKMKFTNSLALFMAIYLGRHNHLELELSDNFKKLQLPEINFLLILVIKNCDRNQSRMLQADVTQPS